MPKTIEFRIDKFTFRVALDRYYTAEGVWAKEEKDLVRLGISDFMQQRSGDVAFADIKPEGTTMATGDEVAVIETIKVNISLTSPLSGIVIKVNPAMEITPEAINQDPYGEGWIATIKASDWEKDRALLMEATKYFELIKILAEDEVR